jgi:hypothetical protein
MNLLDQQELAPSNDSAAVALEMVSAAAAAIRELQEQCAQAVAQAHDVSGSFAKELESTEARAERAETVQRETETQIKELSSAFARTRADLDIARRQLAAKSEELSQTEDRLHLFEAEARVDQQRAIKANAKIEHIVEAIRSQLTNR